MSGRRGLAIAAATVALLQVAAGARQDRAPLSPRNASYRLAATLDPARHEITGTGRLSWRNITSTPATELQFHLYWNAWRDTTSTWMREQRLARGGASLKRAPKAFGGIDLKRLATGDRDLLTQAKFVAPDDGNADDKTVLAVPLERAVAPGESIDVDFEWVGRVPLTFARTGRLGNYYFIAQWFPKAGVFTDTGWNTHQFHAGTEFFSDFGEYDVTLTVPKGWTVGATGRSMSTLDGPAGTGQHRFVQADVHDFAWTTSPDFLDVHRRFEEPGLPPVDMRLLLQPEHAGQEDRHFNATKAALKYYGTWFGPYPYDHITIVDPVTPFNASVQGDGTGGMEYPTLFTAGTRWYVSWNGTQPEAVTVHEAGHQFWYGVVATNEFENAWMDEGLNTYSTARVLEAAFPWRFYATPRYFGGLATWTYFDVPWSRAIDGNRLNAFRPVASSDDQSTPSWKYWPGSGGAITYNKTALWLTTLERMLGWETMQKVLSEYFRRTAFTHPAPQNFFSIANEISGRDLTWFFDAVHRSSATFDYGVAQVTSERVNDTNIHTVVVRRYGDGIFPVSVRVLCGDTVRQLDWDGRDRWKSFEIRDSGAITKVEVDPDRVLLLDVNYTNNSWTSNPRGPEAARKWALRWLTWVQEVLLTYAFFA